MPEQSVYHQIIEENEQQKPIYQKGENYESDRQICYGIL